MAPDSHIVHSSYVNMLVAAVMLVQFLLRFVPHLAARGDGAAASIRPIGTKIESDADTPTRIRTVRGVGDTFLDLAPGDWVRPAVAESSTGVPSQR